jgi:poly(3-hydroxybutyrate) depolymerase
MAVVLGATYPDLFMAIGVVAGLEFAAATTAVAGLDAVMMGGPEPNHRGLLAFQGAYSPGVSEIEQCCSPIAV